MNFLNARTTRDIVDLRQVGASGLKQWGGYIHESTLKDVEGRRAIEIFKEMGDNDATCGVILYCIDKLLRQVRWSVAPASSAPFDVEAAEFLESAMHDMEVSWIDFLSDAFLGMLRYGFSLHEIVYKRRAGNDERPHLNSRYSDGRIGWRNLAGRSQDTIYRWLIDDHGHILGAEQQAPPHYRLTRLPIEKCVLFRTSAEKNNPEGRSIFRSGYRAWFIKRGLENIEAVGVEKDISGLPIVWVPRQLLATAQQKAVNEDGSINEDVAGARSMLGEFKKMATEVRRDAHEGLVMPLAYDDNNNKMFDITLLQSGGSRQFNLSDIIQRWDHRITMSVMADFLLMGQSSSSTGSMAMHADKRGLFYDAIKSFLGIFCETFNNNAVSRLMRLNTFQTSQYPRIEFGAIEQVDLGEQGDFLLKCAQAGMEFTGDEQLEEHFRQIAGWPERVADIGDVSDVRPQPTEGREDVREVLRGELDEDAATHVDPATGIVTNVAPRPKPLTNATALPI